MPIQRPKPLDVSQHIFYSPTFQSVIAEAVEFFQKTPVSRLPPDGTFQGAGVYALYYHGPFEPYAPIAGANRSGSVQPIYVGKAVPPGHRKGREYLSATTALRDRLNQHAGSIRSGRNIELEDFTCRFAVLGGAEVDLIGGLEAGLIRHCRPLWNGGIEGFGLHNVGKERLNQDKNYWDVLHPGRRWADKYTGFVADIETVRQAVTNFFTLTPSQQEALAEQKLFEEDENDSTPS
jgi:hypothetical protein